MNRLYSITKRSFCTVSSATTTQSISRTRLFFNNCIKHKYKIILFTVVSTTPIIINRYKPHKDIEQKAFNTIEKKLERDQDLVKLIESFLIRTILEVLKSPEVLNSGIGFTLDLINQPKVNDELLKFLLNGLKDPAFLDELKVLGKDLTLDVLKNPTVQRDLTDLILVEL